MEERIRKIRILVNPKSGVGTSFDSFWGIVEKHFGHPGTDISYQFSHHVEDGRRKTERAVQEGVDAVIVAGGDGMVNSIGGVGTATALGVIPTGSGNGFARHFGIPLDIPGAIQTLSQAQRIPIDVGTANGRPFLVTCSMAGDAVIVRSFETSSGVPIRPSRSGALCRMFSRPPTNGSVLCPSPSKSSSMDAKKLHFRTRPFAPSPT
jgi:diacylglycerol kinase family enzyme